MALEPNENPEKSILKFESMLKTDDVYFFDSEDFEEIIHHYLNQGKVALGKKAIQIGLQQHPHSAELKLLHVEILVFEDHFSEAETILDELQELDASNEEIYIQRANILSKQDDHQGAVNMLSEALQITNDSFDIYSLMGMEHLFLDHFEEAKRCFIKCIEYDESDYSSLYNVVYCFEFLEDFDGAIHYLNDYLERNPYCEVAWHQLGKMYCSKGMQTEALAAFDFAIISDDSFLGAYFEKGRVLEKLGKFNEAIECYETTISIDDPTSHAYLRIGKCHEKLGNDDLAKYYYYNTVHEDPLLDKGWVAITEFYFRTKDYGKALKYINKAINIDGENPLYWKKSAEIFQVLENYDEADFAYKQTVELGNYELDTWKNWAKTLGKLQDFESAVQVILQGLEFYPEDAELHYLLSGMYLKNNNTELAKEKLVSALQLNPKKSVLFLQLYPEFEKIKWVRDSIKTNKKAST
jgi:tetratricopeptide (TPR) repeat protein